MSARSPSTFSVSLLYGLAGLAFLAAVLLAVTAFGFRSSLGVTLNVFTAALGPIADMLVGLLASAIQWLGLLLAAQLILVSFLLYLAGRQARRLQLLSDRLASLEEGTDEPAPEN